MTFDSLTLAAVVASLQPLLGGKVQRISQPSEYSVVFSIFNSGIGEKHLLLDCSPKFYRAHLTTRRFANPLTPSPFCMTMRKYLGGARVLDISQRGGDRILDIRFHNAGAEYLLSAELMGKHANIILVSPDNRVLHAAKLISSRQSRVREVAPGVEYSPPPTPPEFKPRAQTSPEELAGLDERYAKAESTAGFEQQRSTLAGQLRKAHQQKSRALQQVRRGAQESTRADEYQRWGELLLAHLHAIEPGTSAAEVPDYFSDEPNQILRVPLDARLSPQENAQKYFQRARHVRDNAAELSVLQEKLAADVAGLEQLLSDAQSLDSASDATQKLRELQRIAQSQHWLRPSQEGGRFGAGAQGAHRFEGRKVRSFTSPDGYEVLVGENATANDYLVTRLAQSNDWWLHLRSGTSAHAIIRTQNAPERVPRSTLEFAAKLVVARSVAKHAGWAEVDYTLRKYVRKPRKAAPGTVIHSHAKTLHVEPAA